MNHFSTEMSHDQAFFYLFGFKEPAFRLMMKAEPPVAPRIFQAKARLEIGFVEFCSGATLYNTVNPADFKFF